MNCQIRITRTAEKDIEDSANYIEFVLKDPNAADRLLDLVGEKIGLLADAPYIHPVIDDPVLKAWGVRSVQINNYLVFYTVDGECGCVYIVRFLYAKRDWASILKCGINFQ